MPPGCCLVPRTRQEGLQTNCLIAGRLQVTSAAHLPHREAMVKLHVSSHALLTFGGVLAAHHKACAAA